MEILSNKSTNYFLEHYYIFRCVQRKEKNRNEKTYFLYHGMYTNSIYINSIDRMRPN